MILSTHGIVGSQIVQGYDTDAQAFFDRVTTAGGSLSLTEKNAVNTLVVKMKNDGVWTKMKAIYPMVGASAAACAQNLKSSSFTGTFTATGWTFASTGATPNGTSAYMDTGLSPNSHLNVNNTSIGVYNQIPTVSPSGVTPIGIMPAPFVNNPILFIRFYSNVYQSSQYDIETFANYFQENWTPANDWNQLKGFWISSRTSNNVFKLYKNQTLVGTKTYTQTLNLTTLTHNITISALNRGTSRIGFDSTQNSFAFIGDGLSDTEASNFYTAVQAFQTTLSRQV